MPEPIALACAADDDFAMGLGVMLHSVFANLEPAQPVHVFIIDDDIGASQKRRIDRILRTVPQPIQGNWLHDTDRLPASLKTTWWISKAAYLRLLLPGLLPARYKKLIYLDADLVVETNLRRLWNEEMNGYALAAVQNYGTQYVSDDKGLALYEALGLPPDAPYFNSGVFVMNLERWRREKISQQIFSYLQEHHEHVNLHDQDGMNAILAGAWKKLSPRWNQQSKVYRLDEWEDTPFKQEICAIRSTLVHSPHIIHFTSVPKPWEMLCAHPARQRFMHYLEKSAWFTPLEWRVWRAGRQLRRPEQWARKKIRPLYHRLKKAMHNG